MDGTGDIFSDLLKAAAETKPAPTASPLTVGSTGVDHSGPNYADREYRVESIDGDHVTVQYFDDGSKKTYSLKIKQEQHNSIMAERARKEKAPKRPGFMGRDRLSYDSQGNMARFLGYLAGPGKIRFYLEAPPKYDDMVVNEYHHLTGDIITPTKGLYNIAPESKWAPEANISFVPTDDIPDSLAVQQTEREGLISRYQLFWTLVEHGFTLSGPQDPAKIRAFIPDSQKKFFDEGLASK